MHAGGNCLSNCLISGSQRHEIRRDCTRAHANQTEGNFFLVGVSLFSDLSRLVGMDTKSKDIALTLGHAVLHTASEGGPWKHCQCGGGRHGCDNCDELADRGF